MVLNSPDPKTSFGMSWSKIKSDQTGTHLALRVAIVALWMVCLVVGSFLPIKLKILYHSHGRFHLALHIATFALTAFLVFGLTRSLRRRVMFCVALTALGLLLEVLQRTIYRIPFEWPDLVADTVGLVAALFLSVSAPSSPTFAGKSGKARF